MCTCVCVCVCLCACTQRKISELKWGYFPHDCLTAAPVCGCVFADNWKCNLFCGGYDPGSSIRPICPPPQTATVYVAPMGHLQGCPFCPYVLQFVCRKQCTLAGVDMCVVACLRPVHRCWYWSLLLSHNEVELQLHYELLCYWLKVIWN